VSPAPGPFPTPARCTARTSPARDVDEFEAQLVAGAEGEPADDPDAAERAQAEAAFGDAGGDDPNAAFGRDEAPDAGAVSVSESTALAPGGGDTAPTQDARGRGGRRFANFLRASWAELQRVQWPDRRQVGQATAVVLGFVVMAGAFLGVADFVAEKLVDLII